MSNISAWSSTAASNNSSPPDGWPENQAASTINDCAREMMAAIRRWYVDAQWVNHGHTPTRVDNDTFTVTGDQTSTYQVGRRLKVDGSATGYCVIASSSYSAPDTTVNVTMDSGNLPSPLTTIYVGALSTSNHSIPLHSAALLTSGELSDSRLSSNVPLKNAANTFTGVNQNIAVGSGIEGSFRVAANGNTLGSSSFDFIQGNDSTAYVFQRASATLFLATAATNRVSIGSAGNVTINAPSSGTSLSLGSISGQYALYTPQGAMDAGIVTGTGNFRLYVGTAHKLSLATSGTDRVEVASLGNVTINAPSSGTALTVNTTTGGSGQVLQAAGVTEFRVTNTSAGIGTFLGSDGTGGYAGTATGHPFSLYSNNALRMGIASAGNVTINAPSSGRALFATGSAAGSVAGSAIGLPNNHMLTFSGTSGDTNGGFVWYDSSNSLILGAGNASRVTITSGVQLGSPTGGDKGAGTLNTAGDVYVNNSAVCLNSGANFPATLPAASGANLTSLNGSNISSGTVAAARLGGIAHAYVTGSSGAVSSAKNITLSSKPTTGTYIYTLSGFSSTPVAVGSTATTHATVTCNVGSSTSMTITVLDSGGTPIDANFNVIVMGA